MIVDHLRQRLKAAVPVPKTSTTKDVTLTARIDLADGVAVQAGAVIPKDKPRRFRIDAYDGGTLVVAGFEYPVIVDLETLEIPPSIPIVMDHDVRTDTTIGSTDTVDNDGRTLSVAGVVTATFPGPKAVVEQHDKGQQWQASIGVQVGEQQLIRAGQNVTVNGRQFTGPVIVAKNSLLFHTGVLPAGADWTTRVNLAASAAFTVKGATMPTFEEWLESLKIDQAILSPDDLAALTLAYDAKMNPAPAVPPVAAPVPLPAAAPAAAPQLQPGTPVMTASAVQDAQNELLAAMRKTQSEELTRTSELSRIAAGHPTILATAISQGWDAIKTENAVLREEMKTRAPAASRGGRSADIASSPQVIEAAVCMARRLPGHEQMYSDQVLQAAHTQFGRSGIGLQHMLLLAAAEGGYDGDPRAGIRVGNIRPILKAAFSTVSLPTALGNLANKELLAGYQADESLMLWKEVAQVKSVSDFKTVTSYRMLDSSAYEELGPGGKIKHGSLSEETYTRSAKTYAKMFALTREDIVNDDLGAFDDLRLRLGNGAAQKLSDVFWQNWLTMAATMWTAARGNYITGATTTLLTDYVGLELAKVEFDDLKSPTADGSKRIGGMPTILLVPPELGIAAERLFATRNDGGGTTVANMNIHAGKYRPVVVPWLSDTSFTSSSTTAWWLLRDPSKYAAATVSFLDGVEQPTVETAEADFDTLGVQFRGYHDFGCDAAEYLAGVMSKGAA